MLQSHPQVGKLDFLLGQTPTLPVLEEVELNIDSITNCFPNIRAEASKQYLGAVLIKGHNYGFSRCYNKELH